MTKKSYEGIYFDNTVYLSEENHRKFPIYMRLLQAFVILIGSYCFMTIFISCFDLQIINSYLITAIILAAAVFYTLLLFTKYDLIKFILVLTTYSVILYYRFEQLKNGFYLLENAIIRVASGYYGFYEFSFVADYSTAEMDLTLLLIIIIIPVVGFLTLSLLRSRFKVLCYIIMILPVITSFAMGVTPPEADLIAYILVFLFLSISNSFSYDKSSLLKTFGNVQKSMIYRISIRAAMILCLLVLLLYFIVKQFVPLEKYEDYNVINDSKTKLQSFMTDFSFNDVTEKLKDVKLNIGPNRIKSSGGLSLGKLGKVDQVNFDDSEHLRIKVPLQSVIEGIYLRGYIGSEYTGDSWKTHSRQIRNNYSDMMDKISQDVYDPIKGNTIFLNQYPYSSYVNQGRYEVSYLNANKNYIYAPYYTMFKEKDEVTFEYDLGAVSDKGMTAASYDYNYNLPGIMNNIDYDLLSALGSLLGNDELANISDYTELKKLYKYYENEKIYRKFVYETYTKLPEQGLERLKHDFSREVIGSESENILDAIDYVKDYMNRYMRYTLSPGRLPRNKDFVEYFLYENKIGYCAHYASAGALMLRAMGYPTRYVEGYAVTRSDLINPSMTSYIGDENNTAEITVKDYNAHAWVEVYYDGFGWIPVEFTTGSGMEDLVDLIDGMELPIEEAIEEEAATPTDAPPSPTAKPDEEEKPSPPASDQDEDIKGSGIIKEDDDKPRTGFGWYFMLAMTLIILGGIVLYQIYKNQNKIIMEESYSKRALRLYKRIERLFIINHGLPAKTKSLEEGEEYAKKHLNKALVKDFEGCMDTVRKARFGKESINHKEYMLIEQFYNTLWNRIYERLPSIKKAYYKITHLL
ncbi:MAG: transglutaminase domain-containing protein [Anaerolineaceae bacterium]|nr:MAG: transglutaminase domain-containing protein [Anaerolineaceae bacterium]